MAIGSTGKLIAGFVLLIIGIVFLVQVAEIGQTVTELTVVSSNERLNSGPARGAIGNNYGGTE